jgi:hypothetical protein
MKYSHFPCLLMLLVATGISAQTNVFIPRNLRPAYEKGTRSLDGRPGPKYWQNRANYQIDVSLEPSKKKVEGEETVVYYNESPDTLNTLRIKLAHDLYKKGGQRNEDIAAADIDDGTQIDQISVNGKTMDIKKMRRYNTFLDVRLTGAPLVPKSSVTVHIKWSYTMPSDSNATRECVCDPTTFFVAYWYPQIGVYDDLQGWINTPYNGLQEFYNDFNNYDVTINLPAGYMVWATGEWQNAMDMLEMPYLDKWKKAHTSSDVTAIFTEQDLKKGGVFKKAKRHVFKFKATDVPDFTFAASDHYNWDASSVVVDDKTGRRTFVSAAYDSKSKDFSRVAGIAANGVRLMSTWLPGYPFPYPSETVFNGNDGMEYPMMVNDASVGGGDPTDLTIHEVSHTYFPFMMGINEQHYAWMDEGWASFFDFNLGDSLNRTKNGSLRGYSYVAGKEADVPLMTLSSNLTGMAYGTASYARPQAAYVVLLDQLGYETFHRCMVEYMDRWKGKHPSPIDFFATWNNVSGQNLDWFWKPWFYEWGYPDLGIQGVVRNEAANHDWVTIERKGTFPVPLHLEITYSDGTQSTIHEPASLWSDGKTMYKVAAAAGKTVKSARLGSRVIPDSNTKDNTWK